MITQFFLLKLLLLLLLKEEKTNFDCLYKSCFLFFFLYFDNANVFGDKEKQYVVNYYVIYVVFKTGNNDIYYLFYLSLFITYIVILFFSV